MLKANLDLFDFSVFLPITNTQTANLNVKVLQKTLITIVRDFFTTINQLKFRQDCRSST